ncbi:MAG: CoA-transferase family protein 10 [Alphaproteobacteria bacterium]|jgi:crotonobetainyl-CoA:carnitine CoA-transferase CaiB-like acyl-CoA transferase|nr:CoA-transferase family protein 10 [Alphaproteobacteria bacterium]
MGALDGLLVVTVEQAVAAPYCSVRLADAGARVIKIERPEGDFARNYDTAVNGESAYFVWLNRGKQSVTLDFKQQQDLVLLKRLLAKADIFIQNLAPGAAERAGFGSASLRQDNPRLITVDITGYGDFGPYRHRRAYDLLVQAESGIASITGTPEAPGRIGVSATDVGCGMFAHAAILEALLERHRTGKGRGIEVSLFSAMAEWMTVPLLHRDYNNSDWPRVGLTHPMIAPYGAYTAADGAQTLLAVQNDKEFARLAGVFGHPEWAQDQRYSTNLQRNAHRDQVDAMVGGVIATMSTEALTAKLEEAQIAYARVSTVADLSKHPQLRRTEIAGVNGPISVPALAAAYAGAPGKLGQVPKLGEHTELVRREFA